MSIPNTPGAKFLRPLRERCCARIFYPSMDLPSEAGEFRGKQITSVPIFNR